MTWQKPIQKDPSGGNPQPDDPGKTGFPKELKPNKKTGDGSPVVTPTSGDAADLG